MPINESGINKFGEVVRDPSMASDETKKYWEEKKQTEGSGSEGKEKAPQKNGKELLMDCLNTSKGVVRALDNLDNLLKRADKDPGKITKEELDIVSEHLKEMLEIIERTDKILEKKAF